MAQDEQIAGSISHARIFVTIFFGFLALFVTFRRIKRYKMRFLEYVRNTVTNYLSEGGDWTV